MKWELFECGSGNAEVGKEELFEFGMVSHRAWGVRCVVD